MHPKEVRPGLTLGRKNGQAVRLQRGDETIVVTLRQARDGRAEINFAATSDWRILRDELLDQQAKPAA